MMMNTFVKVKVLGHHGIIWGHNISGQGTCHRDDTDMSSSFFLSFWSESCRSVTQWQNFTKLSQKYPLVHHYSDTKTQGVKCYTKVKRSKKVNFTKNAVTP